MKYYYLVSGLPDIQLSDAKVSPMVEMAEEIKENLSDADANLFSLLLLKYDNENFLAYLKDNNAQLNPLGNLSSNDWEELVSLMNESDSVVDKRLMPYIQQFYAQYTMGFPENVLPEDQLAVGYYSYGMKCGNRFLSDWFEFNLNLNNVLAALMCRKFGFDIKTAVLGSNEIAEALRTSGARDFGLAGTFDQMEEVLRIAEMTDLYEREKRLDALRWNWLEDHTFFHFFSAERIWAFWLKSELIHRWEDLTTEKGKTVFRQLMDNFRKEVKFD